MMRADVIDLVTENAGTHGVHDTVTETARTVFCTVQSVTRNEFYNAMNAGVQPEWVFVLALAEDYQGERVVRYKGQKLRVVRTYVTEDDGIEITCERSDVNGTE
jgi:SPP1 family predicted phage head-tail adaptor